MLVGFLKIFIYLQLKTDINIYPNVVSRVYLRESENDRLLFM